MYSMTFHYSRRGIGDLQLRKSGEIDRYWTARTGSINASGELINAIEPGVWKILEMTTYTDEAAMIVDGIGWKARLYTPDGEYSHYLIHPDGGKPGTAGCIGLIGTNAMPLKELIDCILITQPQILVDVARSKTA